MTSPKDVAQMVARRNTASTPIREPRRNSGRAYRFRNLPSSSSPHSWAVCGNFKGKNEHPLDVLEWARTEADANELVRTMKRFSEFSDLYAYRAA